MTTLDRLTARAHDSSGRMKQPCPHCGDIYEQEFVRSTVYDSDGSIAEIWHCPRGKAQDSAKPCIGGSHTHVIRPDATAAALRGER